MKRKMDFNQEKYNFNHSLSKLYWKQQFWKKVFNFDSHFLGTAISRIEKRNKGDELALVDGCEKLAEKVEPGYLIKLAEEIEKVFYQRQSSLDIVEEIVN